jgi:hypothetical protein
MNVRDLKKGHRFQATVRGGPVILEIVDFANVSEGNVFVALDDDGVAHTILKCKEVGEAHEEAADVGHAIIG